MAKLKMMTHLDAVTGKYSKTDEVYTKVRKFDNQTIAVRMKHPATNEPPTAAQQAAQEKFTALVTAVATALANAEQKASYEVAWKKQKKYKTLRGYVFHVKNNELNSQP